jgi:hypothetical protein
MFPRALGYKRKSDIKEVDITEVRVYIYIFNLKVRLVGPSSKAPRKGRGQLP